jgi:hypothetical protein
VGKSVARTGAGAFRVENTPFRVEAYRQQVAVALAQVLNIKIVRRELALFVCVESHRTVFWTVTNISEHYTSDTETIESKYRRQS